MVWENAERSPVINVWVFHHPIDLLELIDLSSVNRPKYQRLQQRDHQELNFVWVKLQESGRINVIEKLCVLQTSLGGGGNKLQVEK